MSHFHVSLVSHAEPRLTVGKLDALRMGVHELPGDTRKREVVWPGAFLLTCSCPRSVVGPMARFYSLECNLLTLVLGVSRSQLPTTLG